MRTVGGGRGGRRVKKHVVIHLTHTHIYMYAYTHSLKTHRSVCRAFLKAANTVWGM